MDPVTPFDWHRMFVGEQPLLFYGEIVFRTALMYLWALLLIRYMGKRGSRNMSPMENLVVIALGSSTGDVMFYPQVPITYAMLVIALVVLTSRLFADLQLKSVRANHFTDGFPLVMLRDGEVVEESLDTARIRRDEFMGMLRTRGYETTHRMSVVLMERSGKLSVFEYPQGFQVEGSSTWPERFDNDELVRDARDYDDLFAHAPVKAAAIELAAAP